MSEENKEKKITFESTKYERFCNKLEQLLQITAISNIPKGTTINQFEKDIDEYLDKIAEEEEEGQ